MWMFAAAALLFAGPACDECQQSVRSFEKGHTGEHVTKLMYDSCRAAFLAGECDDIAAKGLAVAELHLEKSLCAECDDAVARFEKSSSDANALAVDQACRAVDLLATCSDRASAGIQAVSSYGPKRIAEHCRELAVRFQADPTLTHAKSLIDAFEHAEKTVGADSLEGVLYPVGEARVLVDRVAEALRAEAHRLVTEEEPFRALQSIREAKRVSADPDISLEERMMTEQAQARLDDLVEDLQAAIAREDTAEIEALDELIRSCVSVLRLKGKTSRDFQYEKMLEDLRKRQGPWRLDPEKVIRKCRGCPQPPEKA